MLRTAVLLARNLRAPLSLEPSWKGCFASPLRRSSKFHIGVRTFGFRERSSASLIGVHATAFAMEVNVIAASFVCAGSITMRVRSANAVPGRRQT